MKIMMTMGTKGTLRLAITQHEGFRLAFALTNAEGHMQGGSH
jgi:hypothetical protein